jgi:hypothetical protein
MRLPASTVITVQAAVCAGGALVCVRLGAAGRHAHSVTQTAHPSATDASAGGDRQPDAETGAGLAALAYELLDAHADTAELADGLQCDWSWAAHLDYLRALQRKGREVLAATAPQRLPSPTCADLGSRDVR